MGLSRRRHRLRDQLRRRGPILGAAALLWLAWALLSGYLYEREGNSFYPMLLLGLLLLPGGALLLLWLRRDLRRERRREAQRIQELAWLSATIRPRKPLPVWAGGMARPELLQASWRLIREEQPQRALELGSGLSTLVLAYALAANGGGQLFALEDHAAHADRSRRLLDEHRLSERARVIDAPLLKREIGGEKRRWYSLAELSEEAAPIDFLFVDGPAGYLGPMIRYPALPLLQERLADHALILLDDIQRPDEGRIAQRWLAEIPGLQREEGYADMGFAVFRYARPGAAPA